MIPGISTGTLTLGVSVGPRTVLGIGAGAEESRVPGH